MGAILLVILRPLLVPTALAAAAGAGYAWHWWRSSSADDVDAQVCECLQALANCNPALGEAFQQTAELARRNGQLKDFLKHLKETTKLAERAYL